MDKTLSSKSFAKLIESLQANAKRSMGVDEKVEVGQVPQDKARKIDEQQLEQLQMSVEMEVKQKEKLEKLNEQLQKIEEAILGMSKKFDKLPKELARDGKDFSKIQVQKQVSTKEVLSELVGEAKSALGSVSKGIKSTFEFAKNPTEGIKSKVKQAGKFVSDVVGAEAGYTAESDRFATERIKQENAKREKQGKATLTEEEESDLRKGSRQKFRDIVSKEKQINEVEEKIKESKTYGFNPTESDIEEKNKLIREVGQQKKEAGLPDLAPVSKKSEEGKPGAFTRKTESAPSSDTELKNQTSILQKVLQELSLIRKVNEGSLEYDKKAAQYRNTSGRELTSNVSGKDIKEGGFVDFETATDRLQGQSKRVIKAEETPSSDIRPVTESKVEPVPESKVEPVTNLANVESDNVQSPQEILADNSKLDLELTKESNQIFKDQLNELKLIKQALTGGGSEVQSSQQKTKSTSSAEKSSEPVAAEDKKSGMLDTIADLGSTVLDRIGSKDTPKTTGKGLGGKILSGVGKAARFLGPVAAAAGSAYSGFEGYQNTGQNFDIKEGEQATLGQKVSSTLGGVASGLSFGLLDEKSAAQGIHKVGSKIGEFFGMGDKNKQEQITPSSTSSNPLENKQVDQVIENKNTSSAGQQLTTSSTENTDLQREASRTPAVQPVVSSNVNNNNTTSYVPIKASPRPEYTGSALDRHTMAVSTF